MPHFLISARSGSVFPSLIGAHATMLQYYERVTDAILIADLDLVIPQVAPPDKAIRLWGDVFLAGIATMLVEFEVIPVCHDDDSTEMPGEVTPCRG